MNQKERMHANLPYKAWMDGLGEERFANKKKIQKYNNLDPEDREGKDQLIKEILGKTGKEIKNSGWWQITSRRSQITK